MRRWLRKWLPSRDRVHKEKRLRLISGWLKKHPYLFTVNRKTVSKGVAAGLLVAFIPIPLQILFSAFAAYLFRANLPIAMISTLITNPLTFVPINWLIYKVGLFLAHGYGATAAPPPQNLRFHWDTLHWFTSLGKTYFFGLLFVSISASLFGYIMVRLIWRIYIWIHLRDRRKAASKRINKRS